MRQISVTILFLWSVSACTQQEGIRSHSELKKTDDGTVVKSTADDGSRGSTVYVPDDSDVDAKRIRVTEGATVANDVNAQYLNVPGSVTPISASVGFFSSAQFTSNDINKLLFSIPIDEDLLAGYTGELSAEQLVVFYHVYGSGAGDAGTMQIGVMPGSILIIEDGDEGLNLLFQPKAAQFAARGFGLYQIAGLNVEGDYVLDQELSRVTDEKIKKVNGQVLSVEITQTDEDGPEAENEGPVAEVFVRGAEIHRNRSWRKPQILPEIFQNQTMSEKYGMANQGVAIAGGVDGSFMFCSLSLDQGYYSGSFAAGQRDATLTLNVYKIAKDNTTEQFSLKIAAENYQNDLLIDYIKADQYVIAVSQATSATSHVIFEKDGKLQAISLDHQMDDGHSANLTSIFWLSPGRALLGVESGYGGDLILLDEYGAKLDFRRYTANDFPTLLHDKYQPETYFLGSKVVDGMSAKGKRIVNRLPGLPDEVLDNRENPDERDWSSWARSDYSPVIGFDGHWHEVVFADPSDALSLPDYSIMISNGEGKESLRATSITDEYQVPRNLISLDTGAYILYSQVPGYDNILYIGSEAAKPITVPMADRHGMEGSTFFHPSGVIMQMDFQSYQSNYQERYGTVTGQDSPAPTLSIVFRSPKTGQIIGRAILADGEEYFMPAAIKFVGAPNGDVILYLRDDNGTGQYYLYR